MKFTLTFGILIFLSIAVCWSSQAATIKAASASASDVQTAINAANNGDTVVVPASSVTWNSTSISCSKGITLDFTGVTVTRGSGSVTMVNITTHATAAFRMTGGTW